MARKLPKTPEAAAKRAKSLREQAGRMDKRETELKNRKAKEKKVKKAKDTCSPKLKQWQREKESLEKQLDAKKALIARNSATRCKPGRKANKAA